MPIPFKYKLNRIQKEIRLNSHLSGDDTEWIAWWYSGIYKNIFANSQPNVLVAFRRLYANSVADDVIFKKIPLTALGQVRIGTVWKDSMCQSEAVFDTEIFNINFSEGSWRHTSFQDSQPYPPSIYPLKYPKDKNHFLEFRLSTGGKLIIPCMEFFSRCYGRSQELKRVLATYSWDEVKNRLYASTDELEEPGKWKVKLGERLVNGDAVFLAHAKYDPYTERKAKLIYAQIASQHASENKTPVFIKVDPWFLGTAEIQVEGIWFDNRRSFLGLRITGCSDPTGVPIIRDRNNPAKNENDAQEGDNEGHEGSPISVLSKRPEIIDLTSYEDPDRGAAIAEVQDPDFIILGTPRVIIDIKGNPMRGATASRRIAVDVSEFSSGENHGSGKGIGYASLYAPPSMEAKGILQDMWDAMLFLKKKHPDLIRSVAYFSFQNGFVMGVKSVLIALQPFGKKEKIDTETRNWVFLDKNSQETRGILVARLEVGKKTIYIIEVQRRYSKIIKLGEKTEVDDESFRGMVFTLDDQLQFEEWLPKVLSKIRYVKGVLQNLVGTCPGKAATFKHVPANDENVPCEAAVLNALRKMNIFL